MALRLIEMVISEAASEAVPALLQGQQALDVKLARLANNEVLVRVLLDVSRSEGVLDLLSRQFAGVEGFRLVLLPVEAALPQSEPEPASPPAPATEPARTERISREELYNDIQDAARLSVVYLVMVMLSTIVAAVGLLRNSVTTIIGAMVIAPLLGPNVALALATTLADAKLARTALRAGAAGVGTAVVLSVGLGLFFPANPAQTEIAVRTHVQLGDIAVALAAGAAGALAFTTGVPATLIGVMVAVALLPPLATTGLLLGSRQMGPAAGAALLFLTNLICINLAGVTTFVVQGIHPVRWWEADRARKATGFAIVVWTVLLLALAAVIGLSHNR